MALKISIIVPTLDEAGVIATTLAALAPLRALGHEVIVVDGGSRDGTLALCRGRADAAFVAPRGRARQMNTGAARARGDVLLFQHADTLLPAQTDALVAEAIQGNATWGRFDVRITGRSLMFPVIAALMNRRSCWTGIATGDQAMFVRRDVFERLGGFADLALMEDVDLSRRLRAQGAPACLHERVVISGRRWEARGVWRTIGLMWWLRWCHWRGVPADELAKTYR